MNIEQVHPPRSIIMIIVSKFQDYCTSISILIYHPGNPREVILIHFIGNGTGATWVFTAIPPQKGHRWLNKRLSDSSKEEG
jgi:hypothetical protein